MIDQQTAPAVDELEDLEEGDPYLAWAEREGVPIIRDFVFEDLKALELGSWARKGGRGAIINIPNDTLTNDAQVVEIRAGGFSQPERHLYEEMVFILSGRGSTSVWWDETRKQTFEWSAGSLFTIPLNASYQHFNGSGLEAVRYLAVTDLPTTLRQYRNEDFVFNNPFQFTDRFSGEADFFKSEGKLYRGRKWRSNFVPDAANLRLYGWAERGAGGVNAMLHLPQANLGAHISQFPVGTYKKAHRHGPGAHLVILSGDGFSLLWRDGQERRKADWKTGGMVIVPWEDCYHQHFNTGAEPARYLALKGGQGGRRPFRSSYSADVSIKKGGSQVEYEDEDPEIHRLFEAELAAHRATCRMKAFIPWCTGALGPTHIDQRGD
ncbi:MAG TPA: ethanolamine ammonia lyase-activating protein [Chloroflexota bacterium]